MQISIPTAAGRYLTHRESTVDVVLVRLQKTDRHKTDGLPPGAWDVSDDDYVLAFSRRCTHMGCFLLPESPGADAPLPDAAGLVRCPCHSSCFDVTKKGLVVGGPATEWLPIQELRPLLDGATGEVKAVEPVGWCKWGDVGRGVAYGGTDAKPDGV